MHNNQVINTVLLRISEPRRFIQVITGPRQVGKTTAIREALKQAKTSSTYIACDSTEMADSIWLRQQWEMGRAFSAKSETGHVLVFDEIQKVPRWSETVKSLWDQDTANGTQLKIVLLGSSALLVKKGLTESLAGRFERIRMRQWSYTEMSSAFGWDVDTYITFGGYPGAAPLTNDPQRWRAYVADSLVEPSISRDILQMERIDKPALLRQLFQLGCAYSGQIVSYVKLLGRLQDAGNTTTLAHYLHLTADAGLLRGLSAYSGSAVRTRASSPKLLALDTGLVTAHFNLDPAAIRKTPEVWGRLVESAVGAHLAKSCEGTQAEVRYWRDHGHEVDFILKAPSGIAAIEVKSGRRRETPPGIGRFVDRWPDAKPFLVGEDGMPLKEFLTIDPLSLISFSP
jgi:predicted AAA+ superfamily ATPase